MFFIAFWLQRKEHDHKNGWDCHRRACRHAGVLKGPYQWFYIFITLLLQTASRVISAFWKCFSVISITSFPYSIKSTRKDLKLARATVANPSANLLHPAVNISGLCFGQSSIIWISELHDHTMATTHRETVSLLLNSVRCVHKCYAIQWLTECPCSQLIHSNTLFLLQMKTWIHKQ